MNTVYPHEPSPTGYPAHTITYPNAPAQSYPGSAPSQGYPAASSSQGYPGNYPSTGTYPPQGQGYPSRSATPVGQNQFEMKWKGEVPKHDVEDNPNATPAKPTAPPLEKMDKVAGYQSISFKSLSLPPPPYEEPNQWSPPQREEVSGLPQIHEEEARNALLQHVAENCCYGKAVAQQLQFTDLQHSSAFHYTLETFGEARSTSWAFQPFTGQYIDGPQNGPVPTAWDIKANPSFLFQDQKQEIEVPHTASVKPCYTCLAQGTVRCHRCLGRGCVRCTNCGGQGHTTVTREGERKQEKCEWCQGDGSNRCLGCHGCGVVTCVCCEGHCSLKYYIRLTITWTNHQQDHVVERTSLPSFLIRNVSGQVAFEEQKPRVWPINHFPDSEINTASQRLVNQHSSAFPTERILMQKHMVRVIPVTQAFYRWNENDSDFYVYGFEKKVHAPNYPQQCCCGCSVL